MLSKMHLILRSVSRAVSKDAPPSCSTASLPVHTLKCWPSTMGAGDENLAYNT
jgi:hypothetical protein